MTLFSVGEMPRNISEAALQQAAEEYLTAKHWIWTHVKPAWYGKRLVTPVTGTTGLPDLVIAKAGRPPQFVEVKAHRGVLEPNQVVWSQGLGDYWFLLRPDTWPQFVERFK